MADDGDDAAAGANQGLVLGPLEAHIKALLFNPHHRSRKQAAAVFDFLAPQKAKAQAKGAEVGVGGGAAASARYVSCFTQGQLSCTVPLKSHARVLTNRYCCCTCVKPRYTAGRYFFDSVKAGSGVAKLLEIQMTSLQLSFTNTVLNISDDDDDDDESGLEVAERRAEAYGERLAGLGWAQPGSFMRGGGLHRVAQSLCAAQRRCVEAPTAVEIVPVVRAPSWHGHRRHARLPCPRLCRRLCRRLCPLRARPVGGPRKAHGAGARRPVRLRRRQQRAQAAPPAGHGGVCARGHAVSATRRLFLT